MNAYVRFLRFGIIPIALFYLIVFVAPSLNFLRLAFTDPATGGLTLDNFVRSLSSPTVIGSLGTTLSLSVITGVVSLFLGYLAAYFVVRGGRLLSAFIFVSALGSLFASAIARALGWRVLLADSGPINQLLQAVGLVDEPVRLINNFFAVSVGLIHVQTPIVMIALIPVIEAVQRSYELAAHGLGAPRWKTFFIVHLPLTWTEAIPVSLIAVMATAAYFTTPVLLGGGRVLVTSILVQQSAQVVFDYATAATLSVILTAIVALLAFVVLIFTRWRRGAFERSTR